MAVRVTQGILNDGIRKYVKGDIITGLPQVEESRLISLGVAEGIPEILSTQEVQLTHAVQEAESDAEQINVSELALKGKRKKKATEAENDIVNVEFNPDELIKK